MAAALQAAPGAVAIGEGMATREVDWRAFHFDLQNTGYNPYESVLDPSNVSGLALKWAATAGPVYGTPLVVDGIVYAGSLDGTIYSLDATTGVQRWKSYVDGVVRSSLTYRNGTLYAATERGIRAVDAETGELLWANPASSETSPSVFRGMVFVGSYDASLYAIDAKTGKTIWTVPTGGMIRSSPAVANGIVYAGSWDDGLYAVDAISGEVMWTYWTSGIVDASPAVANGLVYVGSRDYSFYAVDAVTGDLVWTVTPHENFLAYSAPAVANGIVYIGENDGTLYAYDALTGEFRWSNHLNDWLAKSPVVANGVVYVTTSRINWVGRIRALDAQTGDLLWYGHGTGASPAVADGVVYVGSGTVKLYAYSLPGSS